MKRFLTALGLFALITFYASCEKDDGNAPAPPRDYTEQYAAEKDSIENYLKTHYIASVDEDYNVSLLPITNESEQTSIWDQTQYPLLSKLVTSIDANNTPEYTVYYLVLNEGVGNMPTRADNVMVAYRGFTFDDTEFDYRPFPEFSSLANTIEGWQEIIPMFKSGVYVDVPNSPDPPQYTDYGAGVMFIPSGLAYYNAPTTVLISAYEPIAFSFKLYDVNYVDSDGDGILNKDERIGDGDVFDMDTDGDGTPDYLDTDDDGDGIGTRTEITIPNTSNPVQYYSFENIPTCPNGTVKKHLDASCY